MRMKVINMDNLLGFNLMFFSKLSIKEGLVLIQCRFKKIMAVALFSFMSFSANAITMLTLPGEYQPPGIVGAFPDDADFSWIKHRYPEGAGYHSWNFGGGKDGGVIFGQPQAFTEMTDVFTMFNQPTGFYSVGSGLSIDLNNRIDMSNLRMWHAAEITDVGSGSGFDTFVPYLTDITLLGAGENGWSIDSSGAYHLFYNTAGICAGCEMTIHLYGTAVVPVPAAIWLFGSGVVGLFGCSIFKRKFA